jgi:hypothetical protein
MARLKTGSYEQSARPKGGLLGTASIEAEPGAAEAEPR